MNVKSFLAAGCIVALGLGISGCSKDNDEGKVALQRISVTPESLNLAVGGTQQLTATPEPGNASDVSFVWSSGNTTVATVSEAGVVTAHAAGVAVISVASGSIKKDVLVNVSVAGTTESDYFEKANWTIVDVSTEWSPYEEQYGAGFLIDGNKETYWHTNPGARLPQAVTIDLKKSVTPRGILLWNRHDGAGSEPKAMNFLISDDLINWKILREAPWVSNACDHELYLRAQSTETGRYLRIFIDANWSGEDYTYLAEVSLTEEDRGADSDPAPQDYFEKANWTIVDVSTEWSPYEEQYGAGFLIDGNKETYWHTNPGARLPQAVTIDLKKSVTPRGILLWNRHDGAGSEPKAMNFLISDDLINWKILREAPWVSNACDHELYLRAQSTETGRYLRIFIDANWSGYDYTYLAEVSLTEEDRGADSDPAPPPQSSLMEAAIAWFQARQGQVTYSMTYRNGPYSYDCSSAVTYALQAAGLTPAYAYSTETLHDWLIANGFQCISAGAGYVFAAQRGDIFIWGQKGYSAGAGGHTGIFVDDSSIIHCNYANNGISTNDYNTYLGYAGGSSVYEYLYRHP